MLLLYQRVWWHIFKKYYTCWCPLSNFLSFALTCPTAYQKILKHDSNWKCTSCSARCEYSNCYPFLFFTLTFLAEWVARPSERNSGIFSRKKKSWLVASVVQLLKLCLLTCLQQWYIFKKYCASCLYFQTSDIVAYFQKVASRHVRRNKPLTSNKLNMHHLLCAL